jgi:hypothetical protein
MQAHGPLQSLEQWDDFVGERYDPNKKTEEFRDYSRVRVGKEAPVHGAEAGEDEHLGSARLFEHTGG